MEGRNIGIFSTENRKKVDKKGEVAEVKFDLEAMAAWQFTLAFNPQLIEFQGFVKNESDTPTPIFNASRSNEGLVSMLYFGKQPITHFALKMKALADVSLADVIQISSEMTPAAAWNHEDEQLKPVLEFTGFADAGATLQLICQPNPFREQAVVSFSLHEAGEARFSFFDATGKVLFTTYGQFEKGRNELPLRSEDLATAGLVFIKMEAAGRVLTKKLVVLP
ncbi:MAG: T9SS type A sorting domain-containing protein [Saprospiraceae bacterium]|nr:T9SS type A sorting domain-containing protein [Saprospiraceae bacterium]